MPFYLRTGKRLPRRATEIAVQFKQPPLMLFRDSRQQPEPNLLAMRIQPDEGILLRFAAKVPGLGLDVRSVNMDFTYGSSFLRDAPEAYETLHPRRDAGRRLAVHARRRGGGGVGHRLAAPPTCGSAGTPTPTKRRARPARRVEGLVQPYEAGTWGPAAADRLMERDGRRWRRL